MKSYRGVVIVTHDGQSPRDELIEHLADRTRLEVEDCEIDSLQVVILWRSLVDLEEQENSDER